MQTIFREKFRQNIDKCRHKFRKNVDKMLK